MAHAQARPSFMRTLVIHQDIYTRRAVSEALTKLGWDVCEASGRSDGLPILYQVHPNLVILEIGDDEHLSWEIYFSIRLITDIPIILVSDHTLNIEPAHRDMPNMYVVAPLSTPKLNWLVETRVKFSTHPTLRSSKQSKPQNIFPLHRLCSQQIKHIDKALLEVGDFGEVRLIFRNGQLRSVMKMTTETLSPRSIIPVEPPATLEKEL
jgi:two-component SAPR family response regulator